MEGVAAAAGGRPRLWVELGQLLRLAGPIVLSRLGIMAMGLTDAVVVGHHSATQLGYHALAWAPLAVVLTASVGLLSGVTVMTARRLGEGRRAEAGAVYRRGVAYAAQIGVVSTLALFIGGPAFLRALGLEESLARGAGVALQVLSLSLIPYLVSVAATYFLEALGKPGPAMWAMWAANLVNLGLNLLLVPGVLGLPAMGAVGAGWATFGARTALMLATVLMVLRLPEARALGVFAKPPRDPAAEREQRRIGYGAGASLAAESGAFAGMNVIAGWLGALQVAAWAVVLNVSAVVFMIPLGLAGATAVTVGRAYGARDPAEVERAGWLGLGVCVVVQTALALLIWPLAGLVAGAYASDPALLLLVTPMLVLACLYFVPDAAQVVLAHALRARHDILWPTVLHTAVYAGVMLPLGWALAHPLGLGLSGIVWATVFASFVAAAVLGWRFHRLSARERRQRA